MKEQRFKVDFFKKKLNRTQLCVPEIQAVSKQEEKKIGASLEFKSSIRNSNQKLGWDPVTEHFASTHKALFSVPNTEHEKKKDTNQEGTLSVYAYRCISAWYR